MAERANRLTRSRRSQAKRGPTEYERPKAKAHGLAESGRPITGAAATQAERRVRLFKNGRSQAVRIPREFELPGKEAIMRKEGERLIVEPVPKRSLIELLDSLDPIDEEFPPIEDWPPEPVDL
ncbi:MAG TPA: AbrB/MazE/SpoVT family DNA-binding domain-containing protein [Hyphomicrobiaceae bacterium]|jgi:antitoxin VapB